MNGPLTGIVVVLLWGTVLVRLPTLWRDERQRAMWATLCSLATSNTLTASGISALADEVMPQAWVVPHMLGVATAFFLLRFLSLLTDFDADHPHAARIQVLLAGCVLVTMITLVAVTPGGIGTTATELLSMPPTPAAVAYWVVLNGYLGAVLTVTAGLFWRISRAAPAGVLRYGLIAVAGGSFVVALYAVLKTGLIVAHGFGVTMSVERIEPIANTFRAVGIITAVIGAAVPAAGKLRSAVHDYRSLWALRPLWDVMRRTFPDVILFPRRRALLELAGVHAVQLRLYRRVIEIRDGMLTLRDYLPAGALAEARRYAGENPALVEACGIALALQRLHSGVPPTDNADRWADLGGEVADEVAWLSAVSAAFRGKEPAAFAHRPPRSRPPEKVASARPV